MKRIIFITFFLLLSHQSSASLMQLQYQDFYTPAYPGGPFPVDKTGSVSLTFDDTIQDSDASQTSGHFANALTSGFMFLHGVQYDVDFSAANKINTTITGMDYFEVTGSIINQALGKVSSFYLYFGGSLSAAAGQSLAGLTLSCFELHLIVTDPSAELYSPEYYASLKSFENGVVTVASVVEPSALVLFMLSLMGIGVVRVVRIRS